MLNVFVLVSASAVAVTAWALREATTGGEIRSRGEFGAQVGGNSVKEAG